VKLYRLCEISLFQFAKDIGLFIFFWIIAVLKTKGIFYFYIKNLCQKLRKVGQTVDLAFLCQLCEIRKTFSGVLYKYTIRTLLFICPYIRQQVKYFEIYHKTKKEEQKFEVP
jgi:hypothetical protein